MERDRADFPRLAEWIISTHTLTWSVTRNEYYSLKKINISTHTLTWSVTCKDDTVRIAGENFNSHAHVERDNLSTVQRLLKWISTHTLTWSVTCYIIIIFCHFFISTHTLTWSVTYLTKYFCFLLRISTHTLTWSVTLQNCCVLPLASHFNSHAHVERDVLQTG